MGRVNMEIWYFKITFYNIFPQQEHETNLQSKLKMARFTR